MDLPLGVPEGAVVGERVGVEGAGRGIARQGAQPQEEGLKLSVDLATSGEGVAQWQSANLVLKGKGEVTVKTVKGAPTK